MSSHRKLISTRHKEASPERFCLIISPLQLTAAFSEPADTKQCSTDKHGSRAKPPTLAGFLLNVLLFIVVELQIYCTSVTVAKLVPWFLRSPQEAQMPSCLSKILYLVQLGAIGLYCYETLIMFIPVFQFLFLSFFSLPMCLRRWRRYLAKFRRQVGKCLGLPSPVSAASMACAEGKRRKR